MAGVLQNLFEAKLVGDGERAEFDHNPRRLTGIGDLMRNVLGRGCAGQAGHDDFRVARDLLHVLGNGNAGLRHLGSPRGVDVGADNLPSALDQVAGDRAAHDAESDDPNGLVHESSFLPIGLIFRAVPAAP